MRSIRPSRLLLPAVVAILSCSEPSAPRTPTSITVLSGGGQSAVVATTLPQPVVVEVKDADGRSVGGATVTWTVSTGAGSVSAPTTTTNGSGRAQVQWTLGTAAGQNRLNAGVAGVAPTSVTATGQAAAPASLTIESGDDQIGLAAQTLPQPLVARVQDAHGNGVPDVAVTFLPGAGVVAPASATTNGSGRAQAVWTLGPSMGEQSVAASTAAIGGTTLTFTANAVSLDQLPPLGNDVPVSGISEAEGTLRYFRISVPDDVTRLAITTVGSQGDGDADLYVRHATLPAIEPGGSDCQSTSQFVSESCVLLAPAAGDWFILLHAWSDFSNVTLRATYVVGGRIVFTVTGLPQDVGAGIAVTGPGHYDQPVTASGIAARLDPGSYTVTANHVLHADVVYAAASEIQQVNVTSGVASNVTVAYAATSGALNLDITRAYITQAVQRADGSIPLITGRDGLLRVFARGNAVNTETPAVRARFYHNGTLVDTRTIAAPTASIPVNHDEGVLVSSWNVVLPGSLIQPGLSMLVDVDPTNEIAEADESDNSYPESATPVAMDVRTATTLQARLVPVLQSGNNLQGDVTAANVESYIETARALYPLPGIDADVRAPYTFTGALPSTYDTVWLRLLSEINVLRLNEEPARHYYGVIKPSYSFGGTGFGYIGQRAAVGVDWDNFRAETVAHEWGHNFGRFHVDCGSPANPDLNYPYDGGKLGHHGYDIRTNELRALDAHHDLMSYCQPTWSSDYTYEAVMAFRAGQPGPAAAEASLLVWGRISPDGAVLEPSFQVVTRPTLPGKSGAYRMTGTNEKGVTVFDISFDGFEVDHMPGVRHFAYAIPLRSLGGEVPSEIRLRGAGVDALRRQDGAGAVAGDDVRVERAGGNRLRLRWNAARHPVLMVRDARTGEILSFARGGDVQIATAAAEVEINMSDGVKSTPRTIVVPR